MAELCDFQVDIVPDQGSVTTNKKDESYYVEMPTDNVQYKIRLRNNGSVKCDAVVAIDGKNMGAFRIHERGQMLLERPSDVERRFTFFTGGSEGSKQGGYKPKDKNNGLVEVHFKPEKKPERVDSINNNFLESCSKGYDDNEETCGDFKCGSSRLESVPMAKSRGMTNAPTSRYKEGMTALTGDSSQKFVTAATIDYDYKNEVTIYLRLVCRDDRPKIEPLRAVGSKKSTRYPNPV